MKVAIKRLTSSDLSLFRPHFNPNGSKQKAINLNADVFVEQFYPGLRDERKQIHFDLLVLGPGQGDPLQLSRKVVRTTSAKNWRLNGELINNPVEDEGRFDGLAPDDFAVFGFDGATEPTGLRLLLIAHSVDPELHAAVKKHVDLDGRATMKSLDIEELRALVEASQGAYSGPHPLRPFLPEETIVEALFGDQSEQTVKATNGLGPSVDPKELQAQLETARQTGERGEELFWQLLAREGIEGQWVSRHHARAAYDFVVTGAPWSSATECHVDVKSSRDAATKHFHASLAELRWASNHDYVIARVAGVDASAVAVTILGGFSELATPTLDALAGFPPGVEPQTFKIAIAALKVLMTYTLDVGELEDEE